MFKQGDILLVPIPFSDLTSSKKRPVLVISNNKYNMMTNDIVVTAITSNVIVKDYTILFSHEDMKEGNLKVTSCIRADKIYSISQSIVVKKFGSVNHELLNNVRHKISDLLD